MKKQFPEATILRPSVVFGPEDDFFNRFASLAGIAPVLPLIDGGHSKFQPVYVGDVADAAIKALTDPACAGKTYELGGPEILSFRQVLEKLLKEIHKKRLLVPVPGALLKPLAFALEILPLPFKPVITRDQITLLKQDNVVAEGAAGLKELGLAPTPLDGVLETYLYRYRRGGGKFEPRFS